MLCTIFPDQTRMHTSVIDRILDANKVFPSAEGKKKKFIIEFVDGYKAEWCPLLAGPQLKNELPIFSKGQEITYKIVFRKENVGDEIQVTGIDNSNKPAGAKPMPVPGAIINMNGHPATIALMIAKDLRVASISKGLEGEDAAIDMVPVMENADILLQWLLKKAENPND